MEMLYFDINNKICIPVGCIPPACCPYLPACTVCVYVGGGGVCSRGGAWSGGGGFGWCLVWRGWYRGVPGPRGVCSGWYLVMGWGVSASGGCLAPGCLVWGGPAWSWGVPGPGGSDWGVPGLGGCIPACNGADPPPCEQND